MVSLSQLQEVSSKNMFLLGGPPGSGKTTFCEQTILQNLAVERARVDALIASIVATLVALFGVGAMKTLFSMKNWFRSGLEMMVMGASAAVITYMIGTLLPI